ncbi:MAG TPA: ABC transporter transmembrane domain-containing protein [Candidatus Binatia bacterium]|nr:ABC transporter transmembrane domain-containing protein [Candidatus Binatia bacterium]
MTPPSGIYRRLLRYLRPYVWPRFVAGVACMLLFSATNGAVPFLVEGTFDDIFARHDLNALAWLPAAVVGLFVVRGLANFGNLYLTEWVAQRIITDLRNEVNAHIQELPLSFFNRTPTGTILSRVSNDVYQLRTALTDATVSLFRDSTSLVVLVAIAFWKDWVLALIAFVAFPIAVLPVINLSRRLRRYARRGQDSLGQLTALLQETVQGNRIVKAFGMEAYEKERFDAESRRLFRIYMKASRARALIQPLMELLGALGIAGVLWYGGYSVIVGGRTQGAFFAFIATLILVYDPFKGVAKANGAIQQGLGSADRIFELLDEPSDVVERPGALALAPLARDIRFERVSFRYPPRVGEDAAASGNGTSDGSLGHAASEREYALRDVDLVLRRGEALALVGPSGGGKSTIADLIPRFYDPTAGRIVVDGVDVRDTTLASLRAQIGIVTQFTFLFNDTIRANIAYGMRAPSEDAIERAARAAHAHDFIAALPQGYETVVGELGVTLSGGQRQRIAIARALLKNAPILILDEATSALDSESERLVQDAIDHLMEGRTTLVIAHRLATIRRADRIAVVGGGRIVESGTHEELYERAGAYRRLYDQQVLAADDGMRLAEALS